VSYYGSLEPFYCSTLTSKIYKMSNAGPILFVLSFFAPTILTKLLVILKKLSSPQLKKKTSRNALKQGGI
jgi:hypothetical protein